MKTLPFLTTPFQPLPGWFSTTCSQSVQLTGQVRTPEHAAALSSVAEMAPCSSGEQYDSSPLGPPGVDEQPGLVVDPVLGQNQRSNIDNLAVSFPCVV